MKNKCKLFGFAAVIAAIILCFPACSDGSNDTLKNVPVNPNPADSDPVSVSGVSLDKTNISLVVGSTANLSATVAPDNATNKAVTWSSSDPTKATVAADGTVTAVAAGTATITVTTTEIGYSASCVVTVTPPPVSIPTTGVTALTKGVYDYFEDVTTGTVTWYKFTATKTPQWIWVDIYGCSIKYQVYTSSGVTVGNEVTKTPSNTDSYIGRRYSVNVTVGSEYFIKVTVVSGTEEENYGFLIGFSDDGGISDEPDDPDWD